MASPWDAGKISIPEIVPIPIPELLAALVELAISRDPSLTPDSLASMAQELADLPWPTLEQAIVGWRKGTLRMGRPEHMDRFPTAQQLRAQAALLEIRRQASQ